MMRSPVSTLLAVAAISITLTSCTSRQPSHPMARPTTTTIPPTTTTTTTTVPVEPGWTPITVGPTGVIADQRNVTVPDGRQVAVLRFRAGQVRFNLHIGSQEPPRGATILGPLSENAVSAVERPYLAAAFNGGFKVNAAAGGVEVGGQVLTPLINGFASFVIDANGAGHIGVWGSSVPAPGEQVVSVRQNLSLLIADGSLSPEIGSIAPWGDTLHGIAATARSALGQDLNGDLLYAGAMAALPSDLGAALLQDGATVAMELDINPYWIQCDAAPTPGGPLVAIVPGQNRPASQYLDGWTRDFITVLTPGPAPSPNVRMPFFPHPK